MSAIVAVPAGRTPGILLLLGACTLLASPAEAQRSMEVRLRVFAGAFSPRGSVPEAPILASPDHVVSYRDFSSSAGFGGGIDLRASGIPVGLRIGVMRALAHDEVGTWGCADRGGEPQPCPSILIRIPTEVSTTTAGADLVGDVRLGPVTLHPLLGLAWIRYAYAWDPDPVGAFSLEPGSYHDDATALRYGLGLSVPVGGVRLEAEIAGFRAGDRSASPADAHSATAGVSIPVG